MRITSKLHYAIKILVYLAIHNEENGVFQKDLASKLGFPGKFLDQVIASLKVAGMIHRLPGGRKGYVLSSDPTKFTIYQVYRAIEPELEIYPCLNCNSGCPISNSCATHLFFSRFNQNIKDLLESATIEQIAVLQSTINQPNINTVSSDVLLFLKQSPTE